MNRPTISRCTVRDIEHAEGLDAVLAEYAAECAIAGLGNANPQFERYHMLEDAGVLYVIGAFNGDALVGFAAILVAPLTPFDCISAAAAWGWPCCARLNCWRKSTVQSACS